jgi:hypothetical protein
MSAGQFEIEQPFMLGRMAAFVSSRGDAMQKMPSLLTMMTAAEKRQRKLDRQSRLEEVDQAKLRAMGVPERNPAEVAALLAKKPKEMSMGQYTQMLRKQGVAVPGFKPAAAGAARLPKVRLTPAQREEKRLWQLRLVLGSGNRRMKPEDGVIGDGKHYTVDGNSGIGSILRLCCTTPQRWSKPLADAALRFSKDYDLSEFRGMQAMGLEPRVDVSGVREPDAAVGVVARHRLRALCDQIGDDYYGIMVLCCGIGLTFSDLKAQGIGDKRSLSDLLNTALRKAAAFYTGGRHVPKSTFLEKAANMLAIADPLRK